jgi:hypothetical protein
MKKAYTLYVLGIAVVGLALWQPTLGWLSPVMFAFVFPVCATWLWRSEGRALQDLGLRRGKLWRQSLIWGLLLGLMIPVMIVLAQVLIGWIVLTPRVLTSRELTLYISGMFVKMLFPSAFYSGNRR